MPPFGPADFPADGTGTDTLPLESGGFATGSVAGAEVVGWLEAAAGALAVAAGVALSGWVAAGAVALEVSAIAAEA